MAVLVDNARALVAKSNEAKKTHILELARAVGNATLKVKPSSLS